MCIRDSFWSVNLNALLKNELFRRLASIFFLIIFWEITSKIIGDKIILPSPTDVIESIKYHASQDLFYHVYITLLRVVTAFFLAMTIGSVIGIAMGRNKKIDDYFDGWLILALNVPALVTIILCFLWFGLNEVAAVLAVTINKIPTVTVILREGTKAVDEKLIEVGKLYNQSRFEIIKDILIPQLFPYFVSAARSGLALIWKIVLVVELLGRSNGVGFKINEFFSMFDTTSILAYTLVFVFIIMSIEWFLVRPTEKKLTEWR